MTTSIKAMFNKSWYINILLINNYLEVGEGEGGGVQSVKEKILINKNWTDMVYFQKVDLLVGLKICVTITEF